MTVQYAGVKAGALRLDIKEDEQQHAYSVDSDEYLNLDRQKFGREHNFSKRAMTEKQVSIARRSGSNSARSKRSQTKSCQLADRTS